MLILGMFLGVMIGIGVMCLMYAAGEECPACADCDHLKKWIDENLPKGREGTD